MKIAFDIRLIGRKQTGSEAVFFNLIKNLSTLDTKNEYLLLTDRNPNSDELLATEIARLNLAENFKVISLCENGTNKFFWNAWILPKYLKANLVDILQVQYITPFFIPKNIKIVTIVHDVSFKVFPQMIKKSDLFFLDKLIPMSLKRADKIVGVSQFTISEIKKFYQIPDEKLDWIHNAVADGFAENISAEQLEIVRQKYSLPQKFILYIGTLQPRKNLPALIEAFIKITTEKRKDLKLVLAGGRGHNFDARIDEFIKNYGLQDEVLLPGFIDEADKAAIFKLAHVFCFPSLYEGFGIPILEAMTLGVPTLASDIPPHLEITEDSALLFDVTNADDFSQKLTRIVSDDALRFDLTQKELLQSAKFSWRQTAEKMLEIYNNSK
ncbi:MAG: glycosyltransferase family 1 protein [Candidatus Moranbacteria bacterium]|nr:glycosyltransferase family 1 protein [Candidatus Moranbacteria bacterium]